VSFTNVESGWTIDANVLREELGIPKIKLINDFVAQGCELLPHHSPCCVPSS
jgi:glucokinase